ncbi:MAG: class I SAM-dependent methyltransferase [Methanobacteriaceae archaeon]|nr:class I SAM-dependent methyltransferase [Methanobacteriaceae archaeon]
MSGKPEFHLKQQSKYWDELAEVKDFPTPFNMLDFQKNVPKSSKILDVGCGYGRTLNELYNQGYENLTGVDFSSKMIERGLRMHPYLNLLKNDGDVLPFRESAFDSVILIGVLTSNVLTTKQEELISEISRVLKEGGILYLSDFLLNNDARNLKRYQKYKDKYGTYGVFELPEGLVLRHHSIEHIKNLTKDFHKIILKKTVYKTMNGNKSNGFYYIGKKLRNLE